MVFSLNHDIYKKFDEIIWIREAKSLAEVHTIHRLLYLNDQSKSHYILNFIL